MAHNPSRRARARCKRESLCWPMRMGSLPAMSAKRPLPVPMSMTRSSSSTVASIPCRYASLRSESCRTHLLHPRASPPRRGRIQQHAARAAGRRGPRPGACRSGRRARPRRSTASSARPAASSCLRTRRLVPWRDFEDLMHKPSNLRQQRYVGYLDRAGQKKFDSTFERGT